MPAARGLHVPQVLQHSKASRIRRVHCDLPSPWAPQAPGQVASRGGLLCGTRQVQVSLPSISPWGLLCSSEHCWVAEATVAVPCVDDLVRWLDTAQDSGQPAFRIWLCLLQRLAVLHCKARSLKAVFEGSNFTLAWQCVCFVSYHPIWQMGMPSCAGLSGRVTRRGPERTQTSITSASEKHSPSGCMMCLSTWGCQTCTRMAVHHLQREVCTSDLAWVTVVCVKACTVLTVQHSHM